jgi:hypothetical protein
MQWIPFWIGRKKPATIRAIEHEVPGWLLDATATSCGKIASKHLISGEADVTGVGER